MVESQPSKLLVAGSIPVSRSRELDEDGSFEQATIKVEKEKEFGELEGCDQPGIRSRER